MKLLNPKSSGFILMVLFVVCFLLFFLGNQSSNQATLPAYFIANQAYRTGDFSQALDGFFKALKDNPGIIHKEPLVRFKIAYGFYRTEDFKKAVDVLESGRKPLQSIEDYLLYFQILSQLRMQDTLTSFIKIEEFRHNFMSSPLMPLIDSLQADIFWHKSQYDSALKYIHAMMKSDYFDRSRSYLDLIDIYQKKGDISAFRNYAYIFLKRYPFHDTAESVYDNLLSTYEGKIEITEIRALFKYLFTTKQFLASEKLLKLQSDYGQSNYEKDYFNWIPVEISFRQGEYKRVLDWCLTKRGYYKTPSILRSIDLHIARCYLRMGDVGRSIKAYQKFQKKYPKDKLSPEVLWKIAWLYEENFDLNNAIKTYQKLVRIYRRSSFYSEAYFRIGLDYYRLKKYKDARNSWQKAYNRTRDRFQRDRILYWIGKCYEKEKQYQKQGEIYIDLASRPLNSFYNLKAFYLTTDGQDTHQRINESLWELHQHNRSQLPRYISNFQRALLVEDILGSDWGDRELRAANAKSKDWQELYAIGELYERMENFGYAYRKFRNVYNKHFTRSSIPEMAPVFKKLYPMYFTAIVDSAAEQFSIPPELILSVIKKESAFEPKIISYANAYGLMQLLPGTASQIAPKLRLRFTSTDQLFQPEVNIQMGSYYLSSLLKRYRGNYVMALAGYNAGPHRVDRWKRSYPTYDDDLFMENLEFEQTRVYVRVCMKFFWIYRAIMNPGDVPEEIVNYPIKISEFL